MKKNNLQHKLFESGLIEEGDSAKINAFKKVYKTDYDQNYNKDYKSKTKRTKLTLTISEEEYLKGVAKDYNIPMATLIKLCCFAYLNGTYIHLEKEKFANIEDYHREMERRISSLVCHIHSSAEITISDFEEIKMNQDELRKFVIHSLENPPRLEKWLKNHIEKDELFLPKLLKAIATYLNP